jgi:hypothetical protein
MIDGGDANKMREFINWLSAHDVVQTEHLFIVDALKRLADRGDELSLDQLEASIAAQDPAGFVRSVLQSIVDNRDAGPAPGSSEFDELVAILKDFRLAREREAVEAKRSAVDVARKVIARTTRAIDGAKQLAWVEQEFHGDDRQRFAVFSRLDTAVRDHPEGPVREHWAADALARTDAERDQLERAAWPEVEQACKELIERWSAV